MAKEAPILFDTPQGQEFDWNSYMSQWLAASGAGQDLGFNVQTSYGAPTVSELVDQYGAPHGDAEELKKYIAQELGVDINKAYGSSTKERADIQNAVRRISENYNRGNQYQKPGKGHGSGFDKYSRYLQDFSSNYGEAPKQTELVSTGEPSSLEIYRGLRQLGPDAAKMSDRNLQKKFGKDVNLERIRELAGSEEYQTYNTYQDIAQNQLALQDQTLKNFMDAQKRVNDPNFVQQQTDAAFAPAETAYKQYYTPSGGAQVSEFGSQVGEAESAAGRIGDVRARESAMRQQGLALERLQADKRAFASNLQNIVNFSNPMDALRAGAMQGPQAAQYMQQPAQAALSPMQQLFPYTSQQYNMSLQPYSMSQAIPQGPSGFDYFLGTAGAIGNLAQGAAAFKK